MAHSWYGNLVEIGMGGIIKNKNKRGKDWGKKDKIAIKRFNIIFIKKLNSL